MWNWLKSLFRKNEYELPPGAKRIKIRGNSDPNLEAVVNAAFHSGKSVFGTVDDNGKLTMEVKD